MSATTNLCARALAGLLAVGVLPGCRADSVLNHAEDGAVTVTVWTAATEVFVEHPPLVAGAEPAPWLVHLTRRSDHGPISDGMVTLQIGDTRAEAVTASAVGIFKPTLSVPVAGTYAASLQLVSERHEEVIDLGPVAVYASESEVVPDHLEPAGISVTKEAQWSVPFRVRQAVTGQVQRTLPVQGEITPATTRMADVVAPVSGLLVPEANLSTPAEGAHVALGETLATIVPLSSSTSLASIRAVAQQAEQEYHRVRQLFEIGAVPEVRLQDAQRNFAVAQAALTPLDGVSGEDNQYVLRSPLDGFVEARSAVAGEVVEVGDPLFRIVDPNAVWVRLRLRIPQVMYSHSIVGVSFTVEGSDRVYRSEKLVAIASEIDAESRTLPVIYEVQNEDHSLTIGLFVNGHATVSGMEAGVVLPNSAVHMEDGVPVAFVQVAGERFVRRTLVLGAGDERQKVIASGVSPGEFVVTRGTRSVYLASLNIGGGAGHAH